MTTTLGTAALTFLVSAVVAALEGHLRVAVGLAAVFLMLGLCYLALKVQEAQKLLDSLLEDNDHGQL